MADNKLLEGSNAQAVGEMIGSFWDTITSGTPQSAKDEANRLAERQGIEAPYQAPQQPQMPPQAQLQALQPRLPVVAQAQPQQAATAPEQFEQSATTIAQPQQIQQPQDFMNQAQGLMGQQKAINNTLADAAVQKAQFEANANRELARQQEQDMILKQEQQVKRQQELDNQVQTMNQMQADYAKFLSSPEAKVKTNNLWENMGTGQKVLAGISLALGALGAGNTGKNGAVEVIGQAIDRDIDAQKNNIKMQAEGKLQNYNMQNNLYAQMMKKYQNEDQAEAAVRLLRLQQVQSQLNAVAADYSGTQVKQQAKLANIALDQAMLQQKQQFAAAAQQKEILKSLSGGDDIASVIGMMPKEIQEKYVPGYGIASNPENAKEFQKVRATLEPAITGAVTIQKMLGDFNRVTDLKKRAQIQSEMKALAGQLRVPFTGPGALTEKEYDRLMDTLGDPTSVTSMSNIQKAKLQQVLNKLNRDLDNSAAQFGLPRKNKNIQLKTLDKAE